VVDAHGGNVEREALEASAQQAVVVVALDLVLWVKDGRGCREHVEQRLVAEGSEQVVGDDLVEEVF